MLEAFLTRAYCWIRGVVVRVTGDKRARLSTPEADNAVHNGVLPPPPKRSKPNVDGEPSQQLPVDGFEQGQRPQTVRRIRTNQRSRVRPVNRRELAQRLREAQNIPAIWKANSLAHRYPTCDDYIARYREFREIQAYSKEKRPVEAVAPSASQGPSADVRGITFAAESSRDAELRSMAAQVAPKRIEQKSMKPEFPEEWEQIYRQAQIEAGRIAEPLDWQPTVARFDERPIQQHSASVVSPFSSYPVKSSRVPLERIPTHLDSMEIDVSPLTLHALSEWLDEETKAAIRAEDDVEIEESSGIPAFRPEMLTETDRDQFSQLTMHDTQGISISVDNCDFTPRDISTLLPGSWLNDNVVNGYMKLLQLRDGQLEGGPSCHFCKTFLMNSIYPSYNYSHVKKWTSARRLKNWGQAKGSILECDLVFFPLHLNTNHWVLVVAKLPEKILQYYDSLGANIAEDDGPTGLLLSNIGQYLVDESADKLSQECSVGDFSFEMMREMPQQKNLSDCGVYVCRTAKEISGQNTLKYTSEEMQQYRILILKELRQGELL